jgi:hypothetical protein
MPSGPLEYAPVVGLIHCPPFPATPKSPEEYRTVVPIKPSFMSVVVVKRLGTYIVEGLLIGLLTFIALPLFCRDYAQ